jgi:CheY-like chemotaxis protein
MADEPSHVHQQSDTQKEEHFARRMHELIAMVAHELRNPLTPIRNAVSVMRVKGIDDPLLASMRDTIDRQSAQLGRVIDNLLDVNRIAQGVLTVEKRPIDLRFVLTRAIEASRSQIEARGHTLDVNMPEGPSQIDGDAARLTQAFMNVLSNAAKYTTPGGHIRVSLETDENRAEVRVRDNGIGMQPEFLAKLMEQTAPDERAAERVRGELGVGLALVRRVVQLHGGYTAAFSAGPGKGTEIVIQLPLPAWQDQSPSDSRASSTPLTRQRVLVVDDNVDAATTLSMLLQSMGQETRAVHDGLAALEAMKSFRPHIVLLDIGMPKLNGYEVARRLRATPNGDRLLLVAVTGWGQEEDRRRTREAGFNHHFVKPVDDKALKHLLACTPDDLEGCCPAERSGA